MEDAVRHPSPTEPRTESEALKGKVFSHKRIELTQAEHIELKWQGSYWKAQHGVLKEKNAALEKSLALAQAEIRDLKQRLYGKKSEKSTAKRDAPPGKDKASARPRGQQPGSKGHGRTPRPDLPVVVEQRDVAPEDSACKCCGKPYARLAQTEDSRIVEIQVKAHVRQIQRRMYRKACACAGVPALVTAPRAPRIFPKSSVGISVWTEVLLNKFLFSRASHNLCTEYTYRGLPIAPGTLTDGLKRIAPLFQPLLEQLAEKQLTETLFHNDETGWKVFEALEGKVGYRWWLWVTQSPSVVHYILAPSRSGDIPIEYFAGLDKHLEQIIVVCDRYSGYKRLARENLRILLAFCWAHVRRDFLDAAKRWPKLQHWMFSWIEAIGELYALNARRMAHWQAGVPLAEQTPAFQHHQRALEQAITNLTERRERELARTPPLEDVQRALLTSLGNHWAGLCVFVNYPQVPMDNNIAERRMRNPAMGRKNWYGSASQWSAGLAAAMFSLFQTVLLWKLNPHHWLYSYLSACAELGGKAPTDLSGFLPWQMSEARKRQLAQPMPMSAAGPPEPAQANPAQPP